MISGICVCCGLWGAKDGAGRCKNCAKTMVKMGSCRHRKPPTPGGLSSEKRPPFYIVSATRKAEDPAHPWHGPDDYLEAAILGGLPDEILGVMETGLGVDVLSLMELHHQQHGGAVAWRECPDRECASLYVQCFDLTMAEIMRRRVATP